MQKLAEQSDPGYFWGVNPSSHEAENHLVTGGGDGAEVYALWWALRFLGQVEGIGEGPMSACPRNLGDLFEVSSSLEMSFGLIELLGGCNGCDSKFNDLFPAPPIHPHGPILS